MHKPIEFYIKALIALIQILIVVICLAFHILRLKYRNLTRPKPSKRKCINLPMISFIIIISTLLSRLFKISILIIPAYFHLSPLVVDESCTYYLLAAIEINIVIKFGIHLFVILRSRIVESHSSKRSIWFKIVN